MNIFHEKPMIDPKDVTMLLIDHQSWSQMATDLTIARLAQAGVIPVDTFAIIGELQQTWNRPDALDYATIFGEHIIPNYKLLMENQNKVQEPAYQR